MIAQEDSSIKEIAFQIGFADTKYFTQSFKQVFGCTPSEYRKEYKKKGWNAPFMNWTEKKIIPFLCIF